MSHLRPTVYTTLALAMQLYGGTTPANAQTVALASTEARSEARPAPLRRFGAPVKLGNGQARSYVTFDVTGAPTEIGVALSVAALDSLPAAGSGHHGAGMMTHEYIIALPEGNKTPFKFLELNWNPSGHEPDGVYQDVPHFDFHFYTISKAERDAIVPTNPDFARNANDIPAGEYVPPFNVPLGPPGAQPAQLAVPMMGVHWSDVRSAELQKLLGKPEAFKPFTATFIHGSWRGQFHFWEPMITRAHILAKSTTDDPAVRDQVIPISTPTRYKVAGYYPSAYRITWDAEAQEYRIALTQLALRK
jgi:Domain of unknown function (DUF5602)